jgi:hypothetical protein
MSETYQTGLLLVSQGIDIDSLWQFWGLLDSMLSTLNETAMETIF